MIAELLNQKLSKPRPSQLQFQSIHSCQVFSDAKI